MLAASCRSCSAEQVKIGLLVEADDPGLPPAQRGGAQVSGAPQKPIENIVFDRSPGVEALQPAAFGDDHPIGIDRRREALEAQEAPMPAVPRSATAAGHESDPAIEARGRGTDRAPRGLRRWIGRCGQGTSG